jgi:hypothetical protein
VRILSRAKRHLNWIACFNATKAEASRQEHNCTIISRRTNALVSERQGPPAVPLTADRPPGSLVQLSPIGRV